MDLQSWPKRLGRYVIFPWKHKFSIYLLPFSLWLGIWSYTCVTNILLQFNYFNIGQEVWGKYPCKTIFGYSLFVTCNFLIKIVSQTLQVTHHCRPFNRITRNLKRSINRVSLHLLSPDRLSWHLEMLVFVDRERKPWEKKQTNKQTDKLNPYMTPATGGGSRIRTQATLEGGKRSHHCAISAPLNLKFETINSYLLLPNHCWETKCLAATNVKVCAVINTYVPHLIL